MAKHTESYDETQEYPQDLDPNTGELVVAPDTEELKKALNLFDEAEQILDISAMLDAAGFNAEKIPLQNLSNRPFVIRWMNAFDSSYSDEKHAYHCICRDLESNALFRTVIGCARGVEVLDAAYQQGIRSGLKVCFEYVTGKGKNGKYYVLK